jgi:ferredoxin
VLPHEHDLYPTRQRRHGICFGVVSPRLSERVVEMNILVDTERCEGHGMCAAAAPDIFGLTDDGFPQAHFHELPASLEERAHVAIQTCPVNALRLRH